ncbi:hypothetical protein ACAG96_00300 [Candidatus Izemoplasma sp. B36]|uniref:hypothetical protein n=1 Tax=Candidatus Izemoplasma sp. B36 TaxID=3242468 RepID=UPI0035579F8E
MKIKKIFIFVLALFIFGGLAACGQTTTEETTAAPTTEAPTTVEGDTTAAPTTVQDTTVAPTTAAPTTEAPTTEEPVVYGIPMPATGFYMTNADIIQLPDTSRILVYTTNIESGEEENVIAIREGALTVGEGYVYDDEAIVITGSEDGWDQYLGSASIVQGVFVYDSVTYSYLMAYAGTESINDNAFSIGFAVSNDPSGTWVKVGDAPIVEYDGTIYGETYSGYYAPSLVNLDQESIVRLFFTWGDAYGHFTYFVDIDASALDTIDMSGFAMVPNNGNLSSGDDVTMVPNGDFAYCATSGYFYMVKDYSPTASQEPKVATRIELAKIMENELYIAPNPNGWESIRVYDFEDTPDYAYERLYSGTIVTDEFGHLLSETAIEIVYNVSELEADNQYYLYSQHLETFLFEEE